MHFGKQLRLLAYEPWKDEHINFAMLKKALKAMLEQARKEDRVVMINKHEAERQRALQEGPPSARLSADIRRTSVDARRTSVDARRTSTSSVSDGEDAHSGGSGGSSSAALFARPSLDLSGIVVHGTAATTPRPAPPAWEELFPDSAAATTTPTPKPAKMAAPETVAHINRELQSDGDGLELVAMGDVAAPAQTDDDSGNDEAETEGGGKKRKKRKGRRGKKRIPDRADGKGGEGGEDEGEKKKEEEEEEEEVIEEVVLLTPQLGEMFLAPLQAERLRVSAFFRDKLQELTDALAALEKEAAARKRRGEPLTVLKRLFMNLMVECEELLDYSRLNLVGFTKIIKKFVRRTDFMGRAELVAEVQDSDFVAMVPAVEQLCGRVQATYVRTFSPDRSKNQRYAQEITASVRAARSWKMNTILFEVDEHMRRATVKEQKQTTKPAFVLLALVVFLVFAFAPIFPAADKPAQRCLAVLLSCIVLWVTEAFPLFATSIICVVLCTVSFSILGPDGVPLSVKDATTEVFRRLYPSNVPLVLAGFCISGAFKKYKIDMIVANWMLSRRVFQTPKRFVVAVELLCFFMSAWITNIAGAVLTLTVIMPIIRDLPEGCRYSRTLLMAVAVSGSIGGVSTQIASPQNAVTASLGEYSIGFIEFIGVGFPIWPVMLIGGHLLVLWAFPPDVDKLPSLGGLSDAELASSTGYATATLEMVRSEVRSAEKKPLKQRVPWQIVATLIISLLSVVLWVCSSWLEVFGCNIGLISFVPLALFFCTGLLGTDDFNALPWNLIMLLSGGGILGYAVESSRLLQMIASIISYLPQNAFVIVLVCNLIMLFAASLVSSTVSAMILLPLMVQIGVGVGHPKLIVMCATVTCSASNALPISSFPNMNSVSVTDSNGNPYITTSQFMKVGLPLTAFAYLAACTVPYGMSLAFGF